MLDASTVTIIDRVIQAAKNIHLLLGPRCEIKQYCSQLVSQLKHDGLQVLPLDPPSIYERLETIQNAPVPTLVVEKTLAVEIVTKDRVLPHDMLILQQFLEMRPHLLALIINFGVPDIQKGIFLVERDSATN
ncbi:GxxExxY protein [candidate division FCPU426 bacterium]|nr:GxxExxY protein [candidate division FCPU426 bacterium]